MSCRVGCRSVRPRQLQTAACARLFCNGAAACLPVHELHPRKCAPHACAHWSIGSAAGLMTAAYSECPTPRPRNRARVLIEEVSQQWFVSRFNRPLSTSALCFAIPSSRSVALSSRHLVQINSLPQPRRIVPPNSPETAGQHRSASVECYAPPPPGGGVICRMIKNTAFVSHATNVDVFAGITSTLVSS